MASPRGLCYFRWRYLAIAVLAALLPSSLVHAIEIPLQPPGRVRDLANVLSPREREDLSDRLAAFERETTHQAAVLILPSLEGEPLEPFAHRVVTTWKLGQAGVDNGILLLVALRDWKIRIEVGYGLEAVLPDDRAGAIIREALAPRFRQGRRRSRWIPGLRTAPVTPAEVLSSKCDQNSLETRYRPWLV